MAKKKQSVRKMAKKKQSVRKPAAKTSKKKVVTRAFLNSIADKIYNPKTKKYLNLCTGQLQNGHDPDNLKRPMHCGIGEIYFGLTGIQPDSDDVSTASAIEVIVERSSLVAQLEQQRLRVKQAVEKLKLNTSLQQDLLSVVSSHHYDEGDIYPQDLRSFETEISEIATINDSECGSACTPAAFKRRAIAVANALSPSLNRSRSLLNCCPSERHGTD